MSRSEIEVNPWEPVPWQRQFRNAPLRFVTQTIHRALNKLHSGPQASWPEIRVVCISDTHAKQAIIPPGDLLIHAGDLCRIGTPRELQEQIDWLSTLPFEHIVAISGNHDAWLDPRCREHLTGDLSPGNVDWKKIHYLQHSSVTLTFPSHARRKLKVYGAPQIPACGGPDNAFQYRRGVDNWSGTVPDDTDILVTHTPPKYHRDLPSLLGCEHLLGEIWRVRPRLHVFGHIHSDYGQKVLLWDSAQRAYERASARPNPANVFDMVLDWVLWRSLVEVVVYGILGVVWSSTWGRRTPSTMLVNSALTYRCTDRLGNRPQVVVV